MAFTIVLQRCLNDPVTVPKALTTVMEMSGTLRNETSIIDPVILIEADVGDISQCNYLTIPIFHRFYFIRDIVSMRNDIVELHCHVDVLQTYRDQFMRVNCIIERQANYNNLYLNDGVFKFYQNPQVIIKAFPLSFSNQSYVLTIAGPAGSYD